MYIELIISIITIIPATIAAVISWISLSRKKEILILEKKNESMKREIIDLYRNIQELIKIEDILCEKLNIKVKTYRKKYDTNWRIEPKRIRNRIQSLQS